MFNRKENKQSRTNA